MKTARRLLKFLMVLSAFTLLTLITLYCAVGRIALQQLPQYRADLEQALSTALAMPVTVAAIDANWVGFDPVVSLRGITVNGAEHASLARMRVRISFLRSLLSQKLDIQSLEIDQLNIALQQTESGDWLFGDRNLVGLLTGSEVSQRSDDAPSPFQQWLSLDDLTVIVSQSEFRLTDKHRIARNWRAPVVHLDYQGKEIAASGQVLEPDANAPMFSFALQGNEPASAQHFLSTIYIELRSGTLLDELLKTYEWNGFSTRDIDAQGRLWLDLEDFSLRRIQGDLALTRLDWAKQGELQTPLQNLDLTVSYAAMAPDSHRVTLSGLHVGAPQTECIPSQLVLMQNPQALDIAVDQLDVGCVIGLADLLGGLDGELKERFDISKPSGQLHNVHVSLPQGEAANSSAPAFTLQAELDNVSLLPYESTPGGTGIDGYVEAMPGSGRVIFDSNRFTLSFPKLYHQPFRMRHAEGQVSWYEVGDEIVVASQGLRLYQTSDSSAQESLVYGDFLVRLNPDDEEDVLALQIGVQDVPFPEVLNYVPYTINPGIYKWLGQSMLGGRVHGGIYVGYGNIESNSPANSFTSSLQMHTRDGELKFQPNWPTLTSLDVTVDLQNDALWVSGVKRADLLGHPIDNLNVVLDPDYARQHNKGVSVLDVKLQTRVINEQLHYWLAESPVSENTRALADQLKLEGEVAGDVKLLIPMEGDDPVRYDILLGLANETVRHLPSDLTLANLKGQIRLTHDRGLSASGLQGRLFDRPASLAIESVVGTSATAAQTKVTLRSHLQVERWLKHYALPQVKGLSGGFDFVATLNLHEAMDPHLLIASDTVGLRRDWPEPLAKTAEQREDLAVDLLLQAEQTRVAADWQAAGRTPIQTTLAFSGRQFERGEILIGAARSQQQDQDGLFVRADVEQLDLAPWIEFWSSDVPFLVDPPRTTAQLETEEPPVSRQVLQQVEVRAGILNAYDEPLADVSATLTPPALDPDQGSEPVGPWQVVLAGPSVAGTVTLPFRDEVLALDLTHLHLTRPDEPPDDTGVAAESVAQAGAAPVPATDMPNQDGLPEPVSTEVEGIAPEPEPEMTDAEKAKLEAERDIQRRESNPTSLPAMRVAIQSLKLGKDDYGSWRSKLEPIQDGVLFKNLDGHLHGARIKGLLEWRKTGETRHSSMALLNVSGTDMAALLTFFDVEDLITSQKYTADLTLNWSDMPNLFELSTLNGMVSLDMEKGLLKTDDTRTGFLRVFGVLNPATIFRRLKLDFSDLVSSGVAYDTLTVRAGINQGQLSMKETMQIKGPSSNYDITGTLDMDRKTLDLNMVMTLPLTENVPLAALVLGAPVVGGAVWVVDKLLGQPLSSLTTAGYSVTGPWSEPVIDLQEVVTAGERRVLKRKD